MFLSKGNMNYQRSIAELKNQFGRGYWVYVSQSDTIIVNTGGACHTPP